MDVFNSLMHGYLSLNNPVHRTYSKQPGATFETPAFNLTHDVLILARRVQFQIMIEDALEDWDQARLIKIEAKARSVAVAKFLDVLIFAD
jgi:hypothetical protein